VLKRKSRNPHVAVRSKISYHLRNLESRELIEKVPSKGGTRVKVTTLGRVFVAPRMLKRVKEEEKEDIQK
jgi:DNA-binding MarR family transcriptional regulator